MTYLKVDPPPVLAAWVESLGVQDSSEPSVVPTRILPTTTVEILVHYGDRFQALEACGTVIEPVAYVCGQRTRPLSVTARGDTGIVLATLWPWAAALLGVPADQFTDRRVDLALVLSPARVARLVQRVGDAPDAPARAAVLADLLTDLLAGLAADRLPDRRVIAATRLINRSHGQLRVHDLAEAVNISSRQLDRLFKHHAGISPKRFAAINRFQKALWQTGKGVRSVEVAANLGYFDQAHYLHDYRRYAGLSPGQAPRAPSPLMTGFNPLEARGEMTHFYNTVYLQ